MGYICNECGCEFDEPDSFEDYRGECWGQPAYETIACCPLCKSDDIEDIVNDFDDLEARR